jgi:uncharacterized OB-fold protein
MNKRLDFRPKINSIDDLRPMEVTMTVCKRCGQVVGVFPKMKYCPFGDDPDGKNNHKFEQVTKCE